MCALNICCCLIEALLLCQKTKILKNKMSTDFNLFFFFFFWCVVDEDGSMTWRILNNKISILHYFNDENVNQENILCLLNCFACEYGLESQGWKVNLWCKSQALRVGIMTILYVWSFLLKKWFFFLGKKLVKIKLIWIVNLLKDFKILKMFLYRFFRKRNDCVKIYTMKNQK